MGTLFLISYASVTAIVAGAGDLALWYCSISNGWNFRWMYRKVEVDSWRTNVKSSRMRLVIIVYSAHSAKLNEVFVFCFKISKIQNKRWLADSDSGGLAAWGTNTLPCQRLRAKPNLDHHNTTASQRRASGGFCFISIMIYGEGRCQPHRISLNNYYPRSFSALFPSVSPSACLPTFSNIYLLHLITSSIFIALVTPTLCWIGSCEFNSDCFQT